MSAAFAIDTNYLSPRAVNDNLRRADEKNKNQARYTGHVEDTDLGLTYMQARFYDPATRRFLSIDPVTFLDTGDPRMFNRYSYAFNDPVNHIDPDGEQAIQDGVLKMTLSIGASSSAGLGNKGNGNVSFDFGLDAAVEIGIGPINNDRGFMIIPFVSIDAVGVLANVDIDNESFSGLQIDSDVAEVGLSFGGFEDHEGVSNSIDGDFKSFGAEFSTPGEFAGSTLKIDVLGPGFGGSTGQTKTIIAEEHRFDNR